MQMDGTYGDEITLRAISNIFNVEIITASTLGQGGKVEMKDLEDLNEVSSESEVYITDIDDSAVENIEDENEDNNLENLPGEKINLEQFPLEILERSFLSALISSDYTFPNHVCWTFNNMINAVPVFNEIQGKYSLTCRES